MMDGPTIIADAFVITCDPQDHGGRMSILIRNGKISDVSLEMRVLKNLNPDAAVIDARQMLVVPGFVNGHFHPESLLFHDLTPQKPFSLWKLDPRFRERLSRLADPAFGDDLLAVHALASVRHLRSGVTTVSQSIPPIGAQLLVPLQEVSRTGSIRAVTVLGTWEQIAEARRSAGPGWQVAVSLGGEEDLTVYSFDTLTRAAREIGAPLFARLGELKEDAETVRHKFKKGLLALLRDFKALDSSVHLVHLNHGRAEDVRLAVENDVTITLSPRSAAVKRTGYPLVRHLCKQPVQLCLGTDWGETDVMREMVFMSELPFLFPEMPAYTPLELLRMATINGARALGFGDETGSIERGKQADLVLFALKPADLQFLGDIPSAPELASLLLTHLTRSDITCVVAGGTTVYENGNCTLLDEAAIVGRFRRIYASMAGVFVESPRSGSRGRIIPFISSSTLWSSKQEGFEEGFTAVQEKSPGSSPAGSAAGAEPPRPADAPMPSALPAPVAGQGASLPGQTSPATREVRKPELSKNVRRVFGEEDEPMQNR